MILRLRSSFAAWIALATLACGGSSPPSGSGGASPGSGGSSATGGAASASGGSSTGGAASTGGVSSGTGGATSGGGWDEVRCWQYEESASRICYGRLGNLWANVGSMCSFDGQLHEPMDLNLATCGGADDDAGWDETWCGEHYCYGRLGDWATTIEVECGLYPYPKTDLEGTPSEIYCEEQETPVGWEDLHCIVTVGDIQDIYCFGSHGLYYPAWGLIPTCDLEAEFGMDPKYTEVVPDPEHCPEPE